jgi:hypothetical protein
MSRAMTLGMICVLIAGNMPGDTPLIRHRTSRAPHRTILHAGGWAAGIGRGLERSVWPTATTGSWRTARVRPAGPEGGCCGMSAIALQYRRRRVMAGSRGLCRKASSLPSH